MLNSPQTRTGKEGLKIIQKEREGTKISSVRNQLTLKSHHSQLSEQGLLNSPLMRVEPYNPFIDHAVRNVHSNQRKPKIMEPFACRLQLYQP
jgi:hypothetical protein